ncbi:MAG: prepilin-type N-terminal cleavage/methylation domain-containing protein [Firmicutes bacterium]|nr:prepilin-type N-terminal cleavage/methylation domain-containing protein [Bacillota bacterium]
MLNKDGFTLMEVLVVVAIISILAAIAVPNYLHALESSRQDACIANIEILDAQVERYRLKNGELPKPENQTLTELLTEEKLLSKPVECPLGGEYELEDGRVVCNHEQE